MLNGLYVYLIHKDQTDTFEKKLYSFYFNLIPDLFLLKVAGAGRNIFHSKDV